MFVAKSSQQCEKNCEIEENMKSLRKHIYIYILYIYIYLCSAILAMFVYFCEIFATMRKELRN